MTEIQKQKFFYNFSKKNQENKDNYENNNNNKSIDLNEIYINTNKNIKQKANYFNSYGKTKQNKELIIIKTISENLRKPLNILEKKKQNLKSKTILKNNKLKTFVRVSKNFNKNIVSYIKSKGLNSILLL
jgi:hypothetical protein